MEKLTLTLTQSDANEHFNLEMTGTSSQQVAHLSMGTQSPVLVFEQIIKEALKIPEYHIYSEALQTMLATEDILRRDWDDPEEDALWANL